MSRQHPGETWRHAVHARRVHEHGGGSATLLVRVVDGRIELLFHAVPKTGAVLTVALAEELATALTTALARVRDKS